MPQKLGHDVDLNTLPLVAFTEKVIAVMTLTLKAISLETLITIGVYRSLFVTPTLPYIYSLIIVTHFSVQLFFSFSMLHTFLTLFFLQSLSHFLL
jgi:hypothetical protein